VRRAIANGRCAEKGSAVRGIGGIPEPLSGKRSGVSYRAVLFDLGGVVVGSPLDAIAAYEAAEGITPGFINRVVVATGPGGAWSRLERGELTLEAFFPAFDADCAAAGCTISARALMARVAEVTVPRPQMIEAIRRIRARGLATGAITNNWITEDEGTGALRGYFDVFVESAVVGVRKPDPRIFEMACRELAIAPHDAVFLDDIGMNVKAARALGMATIKVGEPSAALAELETLLGFPVRG
jgi:putative hydrolase of the HAD superfamily